MKILLTIVGLGLLLGGCAHGPTVGSVAGGECRVFERPPYAVRGKTSYDQDVVDNYVESGVGGCNWKRPGARPASLDAKVIVTKPAPAPKKKGIVRRIKERFIAPKPIEPVPYIAPVAEPSPPPLPPPPRDHVDELLNGK